MAAQMRYNTWKEDEELNQDLEEFMRWGLKRGEIVNFVSKKYPLLTVYALSLCTLSLFAFL